MPNSTRNHETRFVERSGLIAEREGFSRIAGRIFGLLLLSDTELSLDEIAERLMVSRASVSTEARRLQDHGVVERTSRPGDRKDYYHIADDHYIRSLERRFETMREFVGLLEEGQRMRHLPAATTERLDKCSVVFKDIMREVKDTLDRWRSTAPGADATPQLADRASAGQSTTRKSP